MQTLSIICNILLRLVTSVFALESSYEDAMPIDHQPIITLDRAIKEVNRGNSVYRETVIRNIYDRLSTSRQINRINIGHLFPSLDFKRFTSQEMTAFLIIYDRKGISLPSPFIVEVIKRLSLNESTAQVIMAGMYKHGLGGFPKNINLAIYYYEQAAAQQDPEALFQLAALKYQNEGIPNNNPETLQLLLAAAEREDLKSLTVLLDIYSKDKLPQNYLPQFSDCLRKAIENNTENAYFIVEVYHALASIYYHGCGVPQDFSQTAKWLAKAAPYKTDSKYILGVMYLKGQGVDRNLSIAMQYIQQAAAEGHREAIRAVNFINNAKADS